VKLATVAGPPSSGKTAVTIKAIVALQRAGIRVGSKVAVSSLGTLDVGTIFYRTKEHGPLTVTLGDDQLFPGLEAAIIGMRAGETKTGGGVHASAK